MPKDIERRLEALENAVNDANLLASLERILKTRSLNIGSSGQTDSSASALLALHSVTKGLRVPRMTETQRDNIVNPSAGLIIYNTTTNKLNVYTTAWEAITSA